MDRDLERVDLSTGVRVAYVEQGDRSGPTVLLLHAWLESARSFDRLTALLPSSLHVVALDQRGHGQADAPEDGYEVASLAGDVEALLDALSLDSVVLAGSSSGGYVAQQVAVDRPDLVAGLVLIGSPPSLHGRPDFADEVDALTDPVDPAWVKEFLGAFPLFHEVPESYLQERFRESARIPARIWRQSLRGLTTSPPPIEQGPITAPTLILWGDRDEILPHEGQLDLAARIPEARFRAYEGVGHLVVWEQPARVAEDLVGFVEDLSAR